MRISRVKIENFRSIRSLDCTFDDVTTFLGPNGTGKSTILRALDWFFNGDKGWLSEADIHSGCTTADPIRVCVEFSDLSPSDRSALGERYAPATAETFTAWRTWREGEDKITGKAQALEAFEDVRSAKNATEKKRLYQALRDSQPEYGLPAWTNAAAAETTMLEWERNNPGQLVDAEVSDTHFFGFNGRGKLSELFDFVFVSADLRAPEETSDTKDSVFGRILQQALDREELQAEVRKLTDKYEEDYRVLNERNLDPQLGQLSLELTKELDAFTRGRKVQLQPTIPPLKAQFPHIEVKVADSHEVSTAVAQQGHGLQRTLLLAAFTVLSKRTRSTKAPSHMFLAIEEPELFQHPTQSRAFASVLRQVAADENQSVQVAYATHSPYFVEPRYFDQVRRVTLKREADENCSSTRITTASIDAVCTRLTGYYDRKNIERRFEQVCLKYLPEALFSETVVLVEGDEDAAILRGLGMRFDDLAVQGICVAPVSGKANVLIPFAVLTLLGIRTMMVVDNDSGCRSRMLKDNKAEDKILAAEAKNKKDNRDLCRFVGGDEQDYPIGQVTPELAFVRDTIETLVESDLPSWNSTRTKLIEEGRGVEGKNAATYELAAKESADNPGKDLAALISFVAPAA